MLNSVSFLEFIDAPAGINKLLSAREEGMAFAADINFQYVNVFRRTRLERFATSANNGYFMILRMNVRFHCTHLTVLISFRNLYHYIRFFSVRQLILKAFQKNLHISQNFFYISPLFRKGEGATFFFFAELLAN